jgi:hypothetical protein
MGERRGAFRVLVGLPEGKRPLVSSECRWEGNIKWVFKMWEGGLEWTDLAQDRDRWRAVVKAVMSLRVP